MLKDNPVVRRAIYEAFRGECFFTGRPIPFEKIEVDHLIALANGGKDCIENYVLTFADFNRGKSAKHHPKLERMAVAVEITYAPRVRAILAKYGKELPPEIPYVIVDKIKLKRFKTQYTPPSTLRKIVAVDLFWSEDYDHKIYTSSDLVTEENQFKVLQQIDFFKDMAHKHNKPYCFDAWLPREVVQQIKSIWYKVNDQYFRVVQKTKYYDNSPYNLWGYVYFTKAYLRFKKWREDIDESLEKINEIEDEDLHRKKMHAFCKLFPPGERYRDFILR